MKTENQILKVSENRGILLLRPTKQLKALGLGKGDEVWACVKDGEIIIKKV